MKSSRNPLLLALMVLCTSLVASARDFDLTVGKHEVLTSKILNEDRDLLIAAPQKLVPNMPLLVVLDGEWNFRKVAVGMENLMANNLMPPTVIVGVANTNRGRDLMPSFNGAEFAEGPSDRFLSFLADELIPHIASEYTIGKYHILAGHSNAGMFSLYAFIRRPDVFQANIALSPSYGLDDRFVALLARALAAPAAGQHYVFIGAGGDEEADISVGAMRFAKTFEAAPSPDIEYHYEIFPGEVHGSVGFRAFYRALEAIGQADAPAHSGPARYLTEPQRRRHAWARRFGSSFETQPLPLLSVARPLLDAVGSPDTASLASTWQLLQSGYKDDFRFDPVERANLLAALEARGRKEEADRLRALPGFSDGLDAPGLVPNNYGDAVHLNAGLVAALPLTGAPADLCHPDAKPNIHGAVSAPDRTDKPDNAQRFSGNGDYIEFPASTDYANAGSISVSAWMRPHAPASYTAWVSQVSSLGWGSQWRIGFGPTPNTQWGATTFNGRWSDYLVNGEGLPVDKWVHTTAVFDQTLGELHIYLNGRELQVFHGIAPWAASKGPILIGAQRDDGVFFNGDVSDVRVYRRVLNPKEVEALSQLDDTSATSTAACTADATAPAAPVPAAPETQPKKTWLRHRKHKTNP
ncbi:LamG-like jellyroll fold domain-containing protein [Occallatibacter riparius]|uniref:Alpha/beta hydrolase-fold protein n=1 Tax=Occallatibacter riparius TaxID=1002689 RepID=A0A9J7BTH4_9BACT|nr:LamG-like jellyroll fold domain-containing protein [Occallatibacter riparius]UWZ85050.1 alpha/beta hydrolase-fold protein [Occallatibacter riparius]